MHLSAVRRNGRCGGRWYGYAYHERCGRISFFADVSQVKVLEVAMAVENGADEIDIVLNVGKMLEGHYDEVANEVEVIRAETSPEVVLKVIIESGALKAPDLIRKASLLSMFAGADFVKTSTGKIDVSATPEAAVVMCQAIRDYYRKTGR